jgi:hypothetical protein
MSTTATRAPVAKPITADQRRALFAIGRARNLDIDDLRALTPTGSISALTSVQASRLLDGLNAGTQYAHPRSSARRPRRPKGVYAFASAAQLRKVEALRIDLEWSPQKLQEWLSQRHHDDGRPMTRIDSTTDGQAVIELLKIVVTRTQARRRAGNNGEAT